MEDVADVSIRKARENLSKWEDLSNPLAPITQDDRETVIELLSVAGNRAYSDEILDSNCAPELRKLGDGVPCEDTKINRIEVPIASTEKFLQWFSGIEEAEYLPPPQVDFGNHSTAGVSEAVGASNSRSLMLDYVAQLDGHKTECQALLQQLESALHHLQQLHSQYTSVSTRTTALHTDCEHLLAEQTRLSNTADTIQSKLWYFIQVESITQKLTSPAFSVTSEGFIPLLSKIDQCIAYMKNNPSYCESSVYLVRYMHCLSRALGLIRIYVTRSLENSTRQVMPKPGEIQPNSDNASVLYYSKFRTNAPRIKCLMSEIEDRLVEGRSTARDTMSNSPLNAFNPLQSSYSVHNIDTNIRSRSNSTSTNIINPRSLSLLYQHKNSDASHLVEYQNLLSDCHQCYLKQRLQLLGPCVSDAVSQLVSNYRTDYCSLVRSGCAFLVHVCEDEHALFNQFFSLPTTELETFLEGLCTALYDGLRPLIIHIDHLETLSELCTILRRGMIEEHLQSNPRQLSALRAVVTRMLEDAQERLVYRAHVYISTDIAGYVPSPGDLAYPAKLELMEQIARDTAAASRARCSHARTSSDTSSVVSMRSEGGYSVSSNAVEQRFSRVGCSPADLHGMWYPTLRRTLMCLSKLYRCVDRAIFQGVSLEAVSACVSSFRKAASSIARTSSPTHAALFQIKHLLILREQLAPFQVESSLRETALDWSKLKDAAYGLVQHRANIFSLNSNNALLQFIVDGTPHVTEHLMDSKRDVDNELKRVCESVIQRSGASLVGPLTALLAKADVVLAINEREENVKPILLRNQPFATPQKINEVVIATCRTIRSMLPQLHRDLHLYLANRDTEFILLKPVRMNVVNSFGHLYQMVTEHYCSDEVIIAAVPTVDEVNFMMNALLEVRDEEELERSKISSIVEKISDGGVAVGTENSLDARNEEKTLPLMANSDAFVPINNDAVITNNNYTGQDATADNNGGTGESDEPRVGVVVERSPPSVGVAGVEQSRTTFGSGEENKRNGSG